MGKRRGEEREKQTKEASSSPEDQGVVDRNGELDVAKVARAGRAGEAARHAAGVFFLGEVVRGGWEVE